MSDPKDRKAAENRITHLSSEIRRHNKLYYSQDTPEISDFEYDSLFRELKALEAKYPEFRQPDSPTLSVGAEVSAQFAPVRHRYMMLSLANAMNEEEMADFISKREKDLGTSIDSFAVSLKFDGLAVELVYREGRLIQASTRGDGTTGEDITANIRTIKNIPLELNKGPREELYVRGEIIMTRKGFRQLNKEREKEDLPLFSNPRNAAAGSLRQLDASITASRPLKFFAYQLANPADINIAAGTSLDSQDSQVKYLKSLGFEITKFTGTVTSFNGIKNYYKKCSEMREELAYEIDGVVVKINSSRHQDTLGVAGKRPRYAIAWKFPPDIKKTRLKRVDFQVGRTGVITPVGILEPVLIGGARVSRVTLHNENEIQSKDIREGDMVRIIRSGDVIPKILEPVVKERKGKEKKISYPAKCPECSGGLSRDESGILIRCTNPACPAQVINTIKHFVSKDAMDIDGVGQEFVEEMIEKGLIRDIAGLYKLKPQDLNRFDRMGDKLRSNILSSIENSKDVRLDKFIYALGIRGVGAKTSYTLAAKYRSLDALQKVKKEELLDIDDIGDTASEHITGFFNNKKNAQLIEELLKLGVKPVFQETASKGILSGQKVLFTGSLKLPRRLAKEKAAQAGADVVSSISSRTDLLIVGEKPGSKLKKAKELGIKVISEEEFIKLIEANK